VLFGIRLTTNPLDFGWRWKHWNRSRQAQRNRRL
jgi:hypothetical protein